MSSKTKKGSYVGVPYVVGSDTSKEAAETVVCELADRLAAREEG